MVRPFPAALAALLALAPAASGASPDATPPSHRVYLIGALLLSHPRFDPDGGADGPVVLIDIQNRGKSPDRLLGGSVDGATETVLVGGDGDGSLAILPRATQILSRQGAHFVAHGWTDPGTPDGRLGATLRFARAGEIRVSLRRDDGPEPQPATPGESEKAVDLAR